MVNRRFIIAILLCLVFVLSGAGAPGSLRPTRAQSKTPRFEQADCPFTVPDGLTVECGYLSVPENRAAKSTRTIRLAVATIKARGESPAPDPVLYLEGGPGGSAIMGIDGWLDSPILDTHDLILLDQRGTGYSQPNLTCTATPDAKKLKTHRAGSDDALQACYDDFIGKGIDLSGYNSIESAADMADLRVAMGYREWNLLGISYGTRLALAVMRDHPQGLRSVIIDSVYPPNIHAYEEEGPDTIKAFQTLFKGCAANPQCNKTFPKLESEFYNTVERLDANPADYQAVDPDTGDQYAATLSGADLIEALFQAMYATDVIPSLPRILHEIANGNYDAVNEFEGSPAGKLGRRPHFVGDEFDLSDADGMYNSVECAEEVPFNSLQAALAALRDAPPQVKADLEADAYSMFDTCKVWKVKKSPDFVKNAVTSAIPTLVLTGEYDPVTPPELGTLAAKTLSRSTLELFPGTGHGVTDVNECSSTIIREFLARPDARPDDSCVKLLKGPDFVIG